MSLPHPRPDLPVPTQRRWQPLRLGLVELFHYDSEEFWFRDGHLLLRGNNGTGKSKVLSLTLPFLFDARLNASRIEPDGDTGKKMAWNLLMNGYDRRMGYAWIEFGRLPDDGGAPQYLCLGAGLSAVAARTQVDSWYFVLEGTTEIARMNLGLWLTTGPRGRALVAAHRVSRHGGGTGASGPRGCPGSCRPAGRMGDTGWQWRRAPFEQALRDAHCSAVAAGRDYAAAREHLTQADARSTQAGLALQAARETLSADATDLRLPEDVAALGRVEQALDDFIAAWHGLVNTVRGIGVVLPELRRRRARESELQEDLTRREAEAATRRMEAEEANARLDVLRESVGVKVDELQRELARTRGAVTAADKARRAAGELQRKAGETSAVARESGDGRPALRADMTKHVDPRLMRLLGGAELAALRKRLLRHFQWAPEDTLETPLAAAGNVFRLGKLSPAEHTALASLMGRSPRYTQSLRIDVEAIDTALRQAGIAASLRDAMEQLEGPIVHLPSLRGELHSRWSALSDRCRHPGFGALLRTASGSGKLKRLARQDLEVAEKLREQADRVLQQLPSPASLARSWPPIRSATLTHSTPGERSPR